ncbi:MAG TPA: hypothetical protein VN862_08930 [Candidatus Acidoferrales bacterium]|nr:hypothetical protein [Candidatus Acidoferrales bacterium]
MSIDFNGSEAIYAQAWMELGLVLVYYIMTAVVLRVRRHVIVPVRYEPPRGISPGVAAYIFRNGRCECAFIASLVSLACKGAIEIRQEKDWLGITNLGDTNGDATTEETELLRALCPAPGLQYTFSSADYAELGGAFQKFKRCVEDTAEPEILSPHTFLWAGGAVASLAVILLLLLSLPWPEHANSLLGIAYFSFWIVLGLAALVGALTTWPITLGKLASYIPGRGVPHRPLNLSDGVPFYMTVAAAFGFAMLSYWTAPLFAVTIAAAVVMTVVFRRVLEAPTREGREVLAELHGFREFLERADSDRLNRENQPEESPAILEKGTPYAIALGVEQGWGKELTENVTSLLEMDEATEWPPPIRVKDENNDEVLQLGISKSRYSVERGRKQDGMQKR